MAGEPRAAPAERRRKRSAAMGGDESLKPYRPFGGVLGAAAGRNGERRQQLAAVDAAPAARRRAAQARWHPKLLAVCIRCCMRPRAAAMRGCAARQAAQKPEGCRHAAAARTGGGGGDTGRRGRGVRHVRDARHRDLRGGRRGAAPLRGGRGGRARQHCSVWGLVALWMWVDFQKSEADGQVWRVYAKRRAPGAAEGPPGEGGPTTSRARSATPEEARARCRGRTRARHAAVAR
jgi:hypothetical protein